MTQRLYSKAPIVEAVIDIRTMFQDGPSQDRFSRFAQKIGSQFPVQTPMKVLEFGFRADGTPVDQTEKELGYRLANASGTRVVQITESGIAFSHFPPYTEWEQFKGEARALWTVFKEECAPKTVIRAAIRYINKINIPADDFELGNYFGLSPGMPASMTQDLTGMFLQLQVALGDIAPTARSVVNFGISRSELPEVVTILLDFDLSCDSTVEVQSDELWNTLDAFRDRKNAMFEACIKDTVRELIS